MWRVSQILRYWRRWVFCCGAVAGLCLYVVLSIILKQERKDRAFIREELIPLAGFVESFRESHGQLPTETEFQEWAKKTYAGEKAVMYYCEKPEFMSDWGRPGRDFVVGA